MTVCTDSFHHSFHFFFGATTRAHFSHFWWNIQTFVMICWCVDVKLVAQVTCIVRATQKAQVTLNSQHPLHSQVTQTSTEIFFIPSAIGFLNKMWFGLVLTVCHEPGTWDRYDPNAGQRQTDRQTGWEEQQEGDFNTRRFIQSSGEFYQAGRARGPTRTKTRQTVLRKKGQGEVQKSRLNTKNRKWRPENRPGREFPGFWFVFSLKVTVSTHSCVLECLFTVHQYFIDRQFVVAAVCSYSVPQGHYSIVLLYSTFLLKG